MSVLIALDAEYTAVLDTEDADLVSMKWRVEKRKRTEYARNSAGVRMHRIVATRMVGRPLATDEEVDHIDGNGLNNRRDNLRVVSHRENMLNSRVNSKSKSGLKGAAWYGKGGKWQARIRAGGKHIQLGIFDTPEEAHAAYCEAAAKYHGAFANDGHRPIVRGDE